MTGRAAGAYVAGLRMLAQRELCEAELRARLSRREFEADEIEAAVERLRRERALDDRRAALARARTEAHVKHRGRLRVLRQLEAIGIPRAMARAVVADVFAEVDEDVLLVQALDRRLRRGGSLDDPATLQRVYRHLLTQGFDPARVSAVLRQRAGRAVVAGDL